MLLQTQDSLLHLKGALCVLSLSDHPVVMTGTYCCLEGRGHLSLYKAQPVLCVGCSQAHRSGNTVSAEEKERKTTVLTLPAQPFPLLKCYFHLLALASIVSPLFPLL